MSTSSSPLPSSEPGMKKTVTGAGTTAMKRSLKLPRLPVPRLRDTLDRYLKSLEPFLLEDEVRGGLASSKAMQERIKWTNEFKRGLGKTLQERLIELDKKSPHNWLDDNFWLIKAYLEWRAPLLINSNWWLAYKDDCSSIPTFVREGKEEDTLRLAGISAWQVRRAAWLLSRTLRFKEGLESQELYPETTRTGLWMHNTVPRMFNVCRIPQKGCDRLSTPNSESPYRKKVVVMIYDWFYSIDACEEDSDRSIGHKEFERRIRRVVLDASRRLVAGERARPIGLLSSDDRDIWAKNREYLFNLSKTNRRTMQVIEDSIMILSLDHYTHTTSDPSSFEMKSHLHNIRSGIDGQNRWYDKGTTLIVENNTRAGMMGEHSPVDALVPSIVAEYSLAADMESEGEWAPIKPLCEESVSGDDGCWERLEWVVDEIVLKEIGEAGGRAKVAIDDSDDAVYWFEDYGTEWIKSAALLSPDAWVQMAMQLAWYRTRGTFTATYETALTRVFEHGRTETIRTLSTDSRKFVLAMCDERSSPETRKSLLQQAIKTHGQLTKAAATGRGVDRHLLGLRLLIQEGESTPSVFEDSFFARSQEWKLSTSGLSAGEYFKGTGFGAMYEDGYGINYLAAGDVIKFGIESKFSSPDTSTEMFKDVLFSVLREMKGLFLVSSPSPSSASTSEVIKARL